MAEKVLNKFCKRVAGASVGIPHRLEEVQAVVEKRRQRISRS